MRRWILATAMLTCVASSLPGQEAGPRPMTTDDGLNMVGVSDAIMSPDGNWVFYSKSELNWKDNKREDTYYMVPADGGESFQYIGEAGGSSFQFSPDGKYLSFKRSVDDKQQIFLMRTTGGEAIQLTEHESSVGSYKWSQDSRKVFFVASEARNKEDEKKHKDGYDEIFVDEGPNGQREGNWSNLWQFSVDDKEEARITDEQFIIGSFDISPDATHILFTARYENRRNQQNLSEIYLFDLADSTRTRLTQNQAPESGVLWAPDGESFLYSAVSSDEWELRQSKLWMMDLETREPRLLSGLYDGSISRPAWAADGQSIYFNGRQGTNSNLYKLDVSSGTIEQLTAVSGNLSVNAYSRDRSKMVYSFQDFDTPPDLYVSPTSRPDAVRLTHTNPWVETDIALGNARVIKWQSTDGTEIEGILVLPNGYQSGTRLPLLLHVHGGPAGSFTNSFRSSYHVWAGLGYAQLLPNVRGSSGYTDELLRGNMQDIGGGDYWDLMTGVDYVIEQGYVDSTRMGIRGWSYGGILGGWTITQTNRFKAASLGAMVSDWTSEYGPGFNYDVRLWYIGGTPWDNSQEFRQKSSLTHIKNVETPTLLLHGINDRTDTEPQSMMFFAALKDQGKTTRYIKFPREPHGFREPRHQRTRDIEEIGWIQKYVLGIEWTPWERTDEEEDKESEKVVTEGRGRGTVLP
ncbi:MAG: S9 family peptidase [Gemmatimonadales bacterium]|jgi:dipeptidyl aminopeptidase/acylaminoacyl peptidase